MTSTGAELNIHDSQYCASNGQPVAANPYWHSTEFFVNVTRIRIGPIGKLPFGSVPVVGRAYASTTPVLQILLWYRCGTKPVVNFYLG